jgi:hypothetical protein
VGDFSGTRAFGAGFRLIGREPVAFLAWALVYLLVGLLPQAGAAALIVPAAMRATHQLAAQGAAAGHSGLPPADILRMQATMMQAQPISWLAGIVSHTLVCGAVFRAVLFPEDRRFLYLRLSMRELWLGLVSLVLAVMAAVALFAAMIPTAIMAGVISALSHNSPSAGWLAGLVIFLALAVLVWGLLRLSLALPMSFAERNFRLYESWALTAGQALKMFAVGLCIAIIAWLAELVIVGGSVAAFAAVVGFERATVWFRSDRIDWAALAPWIVVLGLVLALIATWIMTLFSAAWAEIYCELEADHEHPVGVAR